jgi:hypothetical protein
MVNDPSDPATALFRLPPQEFIAARDELAKALRGEGRVDVAKRVKALRKPSLSAWALNQLADRDPDGVVELLDAGTELRAAQQATMSSARNAGRMRTASERRRHAVTRLARVASEVLFASARTSNAHLDEVTAALEAASVDPSAGERLSTGTFERPPAPSVGLGEISWLTSMPTGGEVAGTPVAPKRARSSRAPESSKERGADRDGILNAEVARLRRDRDAAARRLHKDQGQAELLARERTELQARLQKVQEKEAQADARVRAGEAQAQASEGALRRAEERLARARASTDRS